MATLSQRNRTYLKYLSKRNDMTAQGIIQALEASDVGGIEQIDTITTPAAASTTAVHAAVFGDAAGPLVTVSTALTNPDVPRNVELAFGSTWDGGNVTVNGTNQFGTVISEVITANPNNTVVGSKIFKTVTSFTYAGSGVGTHGTNTVSVGIATKLGLTKVAFNTDLEVYIAGVQEVTSVIDKANSAFTPGASFLPNASRTYEVHYKTAAV